MYNIFTRKSRPCVHILLYILNIIIMRFYVFLPRSVGRGGSCRADVCDNAFHAYLKRHHITILYYYVRVSHPITVKRTLRINVRSPPRLSRHTAYRVIEISFYKNGGYFMRFRCFFDNYSTVIH